jgi:hypothetical protein
MIEKIPLQVSEFINLYFNLPLNGKKVTCPYYINIKIIRARMALRVLIGKGSPEEIIQECLIYEKLRGVDFRKMSISEIRDFMVKRHIGIDCSGFIVHILDYWLKSIQKKHLWKHLKFPKQNLYMNISRLFRPIENISAYMLINKSNSSQIKNLNNIRTGDLIRLKGLKRGYHVMLISEIDKSGGKVKSFKYIHATRWYTNEHGVREGRVIITNTDLPLYKQKWTDILDGKNWTFEEILKDKNFSQIRRLKNVPLY